MKKIKMAFLIRICLVVITITITFPATVFAWGDNYTNPETGEKGRPSYTFEEINNGAIGATYQSDGADYKNSPNYPGQIIFNTISDSTIGNEKNFVGARECVLKENGRCEGDPKTNVWQGNNITVEDGKTYIIRLYVHNNNPNGEDAVAENTRVSFNIPNGASKQIQVNGFIRSSNATPSEYWDYVNFNSEVPFHLDYVYGSALLNNNTTQDQAVAGGYPETAGWKLSDDIVKAKSVDGVLIGYEALDGRVPGCYQYDNYVTIRVKAVFDYDYTVEQKVRLAGSNGKWEDAIEAKIGDIVEFRIGYKNTSDKTQNGVTIRDILPSNLKFVNDSVIIRNGNHPNGARVLNNILVENGNKIGNYGPGANAYMYFTAEVVDENLETGVNTLTNWAQASVGQKTIQDHASVVLYKEAAWLPFVKGTLITLIVLCTFLIALLLLYRQKLKKQLK